MNVLRASVLLQLAVLLVLPASGALAAPTADLWPRWEAHDPASSRRVDHTAWDRFLQAYLDTVHPSGVHRMRYAAVTPTDRRELERYLARLEGTLVSSLDRDEQRAYWINLYNALTVKVVLDHYPVSSIRRINISPGWLTRGPWEAKLVRVEGTALTLNDIEHRILRPIWRDPRIHYAVNCASVGCPNLQPVAFTADNAERLLTDGARAYVNHPRGVCLDGGRLVLSSIYRWFQEDFGGSEAGVIEHLRLYAEPPLAAQLLEFRGRARYEYDWSLNE